MGRSMVMPSRRRSNPMAKTSHWLKVGNALLEASGAKVGDSVALEVAPVAKELEPKLPADFERA